MWTKKEIYRYNNIYKNYYKKLDHSFESDFLLRQLEIVIEKMDSMEILYNKKKYCSVKTLIRPVLETIANINFIFSERKQVGYKCMYLHAWVFQNEIYKYSKIIDTSTNELKNELENAVSHLLKDFNYEGDRELFLKEVTENRNQFIKNPNSNKKYWFNFNNDLKGIEEFLKEYIGTEAILMYKLYSLNVHGVDVVNFNKNDSMYWLQADELNLMMLEHYFNSILAKYISYFNILDNIQSDIDYLSDRDDELIKYQKELKNGDFDSARAQIKK